MTSTYDTLVNQSGDYHLGIVGSPSDTTEIVIDILQTQEQSKILGQLVYVVIPQEDHYLAVVGQISRIETKNRWHEDPTFRGIIKRRGELPHLSGRADVRTATISVQAAFEFGEDERVEVEEGILATSPSTGAVVFRLRNEILDALLQKHKGKVVYLGRAYSTNVRMPFWLRHFGMGPAGAGEAYHIGVFGKTGSGKSGLAAYLLLGYARHNQMGVLFIDPQGQFTSNKDLPFDLHGALKSHGRDVEIYRLSNQIRLPNNARLFSKLLSRTDFYRKIGVRARENQNYAEEELIKIILNQLKENNSKLEEPGPDFFKSLITALAADVKALENIYSAKSQPLQRLTNNLTRLLDEPQTLADFETECWTPVSDLFSKNDSQGNERTSLNSIIAKVIGGQASSRPVVFLDISGTGASLSEDDETKALILREIISALTWQGEKAFREDNGINCLVILDEAHRFASRVNNSETESDSTTLSKHLVKGVRETRKYGLGYMFVTQTLASIHPDILGQLRIKFFGHGLSMGQELTKLKEEIGSDSKALSLYASFTDPASGAKREFPFMVTGPASPLSFTGAPLFFQTFTDFEQEYKRANK